MVVTRADHVTTLDGELRNHPFMIFTQFQQNFTPSTYVRPHICTDTYTTPKFNDHWFRKTFFLVRYTPVIWNSQPNRRHVVRLEHSFKRHLKTSLLVVKSVSCKNCGISVWENRPNSFYSSSSPQKSLNIFVTAYQISIKLYLKHFCEKRISKSQHCDRRGHRDPRLLGKASGKTQLEKPGLQV